MNNYNVLLNREKEKTLKNCGKKYFDKATKQLRALEISKTGNVRIFQWKGHIEESVVLTNEELNEIVKLANK